MICKNCGMTNDDSSTFCEVCGAQLNATAGSQPVYEEQTAYRAQPAYEPQPQPAPQPQPYVYQPPVYQPEIDYGEFTGEVQKYKKEAKTIKTFGIVSICLSLAFIPLGIANFILAFIPFINLISMFLFPLLIGAADIAGLVFGIITLVKSGKAKLPEDMDEALAEALNNVEGKSIKTGRTLGLVGVIVFAARMALGILAIIATVLLFFITGALPFGLAMFEEFLYYL